MGFPTLRKDPAPQCAAAAVSLDRPPVWAATTYTCPRCETRVAAIPTECPVCDLPLVSAPHLARSHHHLFPVPMFVEKSGEGEWRGCRAALVGGGAASPRCSSAFCADWTRDWHATVATCPSKCCAPMVGAIIEGGAGVSQGQHAGFVSSDQACRALLRRNFAEERKPDYSTEPCYSDPCEINSATVVSS